MGRKNLIISGVFIIVVLIVGVWWFNKQTLGGIAQQQNPSELLSSADIVQNNQFVPSQYANLFNWNSLKPSLNQIIASTSLGNFFQHGSRVNVDSVYNMTEDGAFTVLVTIADDQGNVVGSAHSPYYTLLRIKNSQPAPVLLKYKDGTISSPMLMMGGGGSGAYGEDLQFSSSTHGIYSGNYISYDITSGDNKDSCEGDVYTWNSQTGLFEYDSQLSATYQQSYCHQVVQTLRAEGLPTSLIF